MAFLNNCGNYKHSMKGIGCRNVQKYVNNHNRQVARVLEAHPQTDIFLQNILGVNNQQRGGSSIFTLSAQQILYYSAEHFIGYNLTTKQTEVIDKEGSFGHEVIYIDRFRTQSKNDLILTIEKHNHQLFVGQLQINGNLTDIKGRFSQTKEKNYVWKVSKLSNKHHYHILDVRYHPVKQYIYLLTALRGGEKVEKYLWVYDLKRECMIMSPFIKPSLSKAQPDRLWVTEDPSEVYFMGGNYFRMWTISFTQKTMKESNYRNIERAVSSKKILKLFYLHVGNSKHLSVLTQSNMLLLKRNQLVSVNSLPKKSLKQIKNKENIEVELQNSLNQIYRMKFQFDQEENQKGLQDTQQTMLNQTDNEDFICSSEVWQGEHGESIVVATENGSLLTYSFVGGQMKLVNHLVMKKNYYFQYITVAKKGELIVLSQKNCQNLYVINKYNLNSEEKEEELKMFWGMGQVDKTQTISLSSPSVHQRLCTLDVNNNFKLWSFMGKERKILFEEKMSAKVSKIAVHPSGLLVAINYPDQIKLMSLLPTGMYEVMCAKTNYDSVGLQYSQCGNFLVSNQQNLLMFYNPFTLRTLGYIEPPELKSKIVNFQITALGNYIAYQTSDFNFYVQPLELQTSYRNDVVVPVHSQKQVYTCFHFDNNVTNCLSNKHGQPQSIFIGCTQSKYMVVYQNCGKELVVEYPVEDCHIVGMCVADGWLFAATSKHSLRVYKWPIRENQCQLEIINFEQKAVKLKHPKYEQFFFWSEDKKITKIHKLNFTNKIMLTRDDGIMVVVAYSKHHLQKFEEQAERKRLTSLLNSTFFITKNESDKRNRMIEKTQNDILKIENEITKEKVILERKYQDECDQYRKNFEEKLDIQIHQKNQYLKKMKEGNCEMRCELDIKRRQFEKKKLGTKQLYQNKQRYEDGRNMNIQEKIDEVVSSHKKKIGGMVQEHKKKIGQMKAQYRGKVSRIKDEFEMMVTNEYPSLVSLGELQNRKKEKRIQSKPSRRCSLLIQKQKSGNLSLQHALNDEQILQLNCKVEEINHSNVTLSRQLEELKRKVRAAEFQDELMQKQFQKHLEQYNSSRFCNLSLHSQVLKMRTQLLERKDIMENKQDIINIAYQERQKLQNYKELVKGNLSKLNNGKEALQGVCFQKEQEVELIFAQLNQNLNEFEEMKRKDTKLNDLLKVHQKDKKKEQGKIQKSVNRLQELKRYLLLQGLTEDQEQKEMFVEQENLLTNINFYKKRLTMETLKEKKNKGLKKSALNLVLKQNKNLLEEVNHLREETLGFDHEIGNLGKKLGEANKMISIQSKLRGQKTEVKEQHNQLEAIRAMFSHQMAHYTQEDEDELMTYDLE